MKKVINIFKSLRRSVRHIVLGHLTYEHKDLEMKIDRNRFLLGRIFADNMRGKKINNLSDVEFQVYSQFGEDGIIQYLIRNIVIENEIFVEIGCGNFEESNTRFLLENNNWSGLIIDREKDHVKFLKSDRGKLLKYAYEIQTITAQIEPSNINGYLKKSGITGDIGLLSIDIDGVDYWVLRQISVISPRIIVVEYNSTFGFKRSVTVPYLRDFDRMKAHYSGLYFGASLKAFYNILSKNNYVFVGSNTTGNNAFFVRKDVLGNVAKKTLLQGYVKSKFRESKDKFGNLSYVSEHSKRLKIIASESLIDLETGRKIKCLELIEER